MTARSKLIVRQSREQLHTALVARTWELAEYLDDIASAELLGEEQGDGGLQSASHAWRAIPDVPPLLAPHIDDSHFSWTATVQWSDDNFESRWRIEPHALRETLSCTANVSLGVALGGRATQVAIEVALEGLERQQGIETIAYRIVIVNWQKLVAAAERRIEAGQAALSARAT